MNTDDYTKELEQFSQKLVELAKKINEKLKEKEKLTNELKEKEMQANRLQKEIFLCRKRLYELGLELAELKEKKKEIGHETEKN